MKDIKLLLVVVLLLGVVWITYQKWRKEPFVTTTLEEKIQDRFNPFMGLIDPKQNPIAPLGISPTNAKTLRELHKVALNPEGFQNEEITVPITTSEDMLVLS